MLPEDIRRLRISARALVASIDRADAAIARIGNLKRDDAIRRAHADAAAAADDAAAMLLRIDEFNCRRGGDVHLRSAIIETSSTAVSDAVCG
jgi:hypothetical protein